MKCPNCGNEIGRFELSQNCKNCGVNLFYFQQEELLSTDAKRCELEYASARLFSARLKAAFIGGPLQIIRIVLAVACVGVLFIPIAKLEVALPLFNHTISFSGFGMYQSVSDGSLLALLDFARIGVVSGVARAALMLVAALVLLVIADVSILVTEILSFTGIKRSAVAMSVLSAIGSLGSLLAFVLSRYFASSAQTLSTITVKTGFGEWAALASYVLLLLVNILIIVKKIAPKYKEVDLQRVALRKKVKNGEVSYKDLPLPVFESDEEREKRLAEEKADEELERTVASNVV